VKGRANTSIVDAVVWEEILVIFFTSEKIALLACTQAGKYTCITYVDELDSHLMSPIPDKKRDISSLAFFSSLPSVQRPKSIRYRNPTQKMSSSFSEPTCLNRARQEIMPRFLEAENAGNATDKPIKSEKCERWEEETQTANTFGWTWVTHA